ncbi:hypothetical protein K438DRAFT_2016493 [Mycena galopus ATCC 62051]|nr:hypothetical protein K438DRAFT_2016493 [Mycena galopus ATCC 62051]
MTNPLLTVTVATVVLETFLYGALLITFSANLYLRISRCRKAGQPNTRLCCDFVTVSSITIFALCTVHWTIVVARFCHGLLSTPDMASAMLFFADGSQILFVTQSTLGEITLLVGDAVIVYRLWLIWGWDLCVVLVPAISWLGNFVSALVMTVIFARSSTGHHLSLGSGIRWTIVNWVLTGITNIYCTAFIAQKVWRAVRGMGDGPLMYALAILIESAAIWTVWVVFIAITVEKGSVLQWLTGLTPEVIGLVNMFIHLRVELGWSHSQPDGSAAALTSPASIEVWVGTSTRAVEAESDGSVMYQSTVNDKSPRV